MRRVPYYTKKQIEILTQLQRKHYKDADWSEWDKKLARYNRIWDWERKHRALQHNKK